MSYIRNYVYIYFFSLYKYYRLIECNLGRKPVNLADHIWKLVLSYLFRDAITLSWALKYYQAKEQGDKVAEIE